VALLIAVAVAVAGYAALLALRRGPADGVDPVSLMPVPALPQPERLPRRPSFAPASLPVFDDSLGNVARPLTIEIRDLAESLAAAAGVAVVDDVTSAVLEWLPLAGVPRQGDRLQLLTQAPARRPLAVCLASSAATARFGFWSRTTIAADGQPASVQLAAKAQWVTVRPVTLPAGGGQDLRLRRVGEPQWRCLDRAPEPSTDGSTRFLLGPGDYELVPWTDGPWLPVRLGVPGPNEVTAAFERPPVPGARS